MSSKQNFSTMVDKVMSTEAHISMSFIPAFYTC